MIACYCHGKQQVERRPEEAGRRTHLTGLGGETFGMLACGPEFEIFTSRQTRVC